MYQMVEDGFFGTTPLVVVAPSILGAPIPVFTGRQCPCAWLSRRRRLNCSVHRP
ncbi:MAG: hypothetical protein ACREYE_18145 [Gammaproteobacteria bacterium]